MDDLNIIAEQVGAALKSRGLMLASAESCTGGWVGEAVTSVAGSSHWYDRGFITYTNESKQEMLGVSAQTLAEFGAVSEQTVREMAAGALKHSSAQVALAMRRTEAALHGVLLQARASGEIGDRVDPPALARYLTSSLNGLRVMAKTTDDNAALRDIVDVTLSVLD